MTDALIIRLTEIWHSSAQRNKWELVDDVPAFLQDVAQRFEGTDEPKDAVLSLTILRAYNGVLHRALMRRDERAVAELQQTCIRMANSWKLSDDELEGVVQEVVARMLKQVAGMKDPESTILYMRNVIRTVVREQRPDQQSISLDAGIAAGTLIEPQTLYATAEAAEQAVVEQEILDLLRRKLTNPLERTVLIRTLFLGEKPREIAAALGITAHMVSVLCYRANQRLRADPEVLKFFE